MRTIQYSQQKSHICLCNVKIDAINVQPFFIQLRIHRKKANFVLGNTELYLHEKGNKCVSFYLTTIHFIIIIIILKGCTSLKPQKNLRSPPTQVKTLTLGISMLSLNHIFEFYHLVSLVFFHLPPLTQSKLIKIPSRTTTKEEREGESM